MFDGWKRAAVLALVVIALAIYTVVRPVPERSDVDRLEARLAEFPVQGMDRQSPELGAFSRYYANVRPKTWDDLPFFTTIPAEVELPQRALVAGVLFKPGTPLAEEGDWNAKGVGAFRVPSGKLPTAVHGGCNVVNVLYDPRDDFIVAAWCNYDYPPRTPSEVAR